MLYFLTGITASGKSDLAHRIAIENNMSILSVDSMAVYKGLNVLTAKPSDVMQAQVKYYGLDIADCDQNFSIIDYLNYLIEQDIPENKKLTVKKTVTPKQGRVVIFDGRYWHTAEQPKYNTRLIINYNLV